MRVIIEKLAPTGEGIARTEEGVGFVAGALPGEELEAEVDQVGKRFWKGRALEVLRASHDRRAGPHAHCAGCDWAYFEPAAALEAKRALFLETVERIGKIDPSSLGPLPAEASPPRYRLRARFHVSGSGKETALGYFAPRTHWVTPAEGCEALSREMAALLPRIRDAIAASGARVNEVSLLETQDSHKRIGRFRIEESGHGASRLAANLSPLLQGFRLELGKRILSAEGEKRLVLEVGRRPFPVSADTFFQANRHLVGALFEMVRDFSREVPAGRALDAFGGSGLFAGALLEAGHEVTTVEASPAAAGDAEAARSLWPDRSRWSIVRQPISSFAARPRMAFDVAVVDPPRAGLERDFAQLLAARAGRIVYVSCEPATLARDLKEILAHDFRIISARLFDLFAGTHRVEAVVALERKRAA